VYDTAPLMEVLQGSNVNPDKDFKKFIRRLKIKDNAIAYQ
jgi:hypothetical protein